MFKTCTTLYAGLLLMAFAAFADDRTVLTLTPAEQARMQRQAIVSDSAEARMTPRERANVDGRKQANATRIEKIGDTGSQMRAQETAAAIAASKAAAVPHAGTLNTPEGDRLMKQQKGQ